MSLHHSPFAAPADCLPRRNTLPLADELHAIFRAQYAWFLETFTLAGPPAANSLTLAGWMQPEMLATLIKRYGEHIYRDSNEAQQLKPLKSLWAQWYLGLLLPPLMLALLSAGRAIDVRPARLRASFHETGRVAHFYLDVREDCHATGLPPHLRLETLWIQGVRPVVAALEASGDINGKLIWSNIGYLVNWFLGEMRDRLGDEQYHALRHACFFNAQFSDASANPLYRTVVPRNGLLARRTCCQRNRLPGVQQCGDCTLK
ncbi:siderophore-iron reductase FhuF [Enterobacteriaceae bacterium YMB-R22]|jgi:ferric iron reductase protein FhuF|uniref:siderophore-iron reductase FhuF n=1 Tax=Tenebrionicola larvae TaxID=2815733 RepID=UPI0020120821|nr:siderophore-iron reductase FhuF [Tenebrionicola larvae]MBV4412399.1 siderophore-iron reductase FhuF [Tenebrionicola larvae]